MSETQQVMEMPSNAEMVEGFKRLKQFQALVQREMVPGVDYGLVPGAKKKTLWKPGAEKLVKLHGYFAHYTEVERIESWDKTAPMFRYRYKCVLSDKHESFVGEGEGECNSLETKYRYRWDKGQRVDNEEIFSQVNTILKMARKRAFIAATIEACRLSDIFTQDISSDEADDAVAPMPDGDGTPPAEGEKDNKKITAGQLSLMWAVGHKHEAPPPKLIEMLSGMFPDIECVNNAKSGKPEPNPKALTVSQWKQVIRHLDPEFKFSQ